MKNMRIIKKTFFSSIKYHDYELMKMTTRLRVLAEARKFAVVARKH